MSLDPISAGIDLITSIVSRVWPDKTEQEKAQLVAALQEDNNLTTLLSKQADIDIAEAQSANWYIAAARPTIMWVCAAIFTWHYLIDPIFIFFGYPGHGPNFDLATISNITLGMLGLGGMRTYEKIKDVHDKH